MAAEDPDFVALSVAVTSIVAQATAFADAADSGATQPKDAAEAALRASAAALPALLADADAAVEALEA